MKEGLLNTFDELIKECIAPFLKANGFKKQNLNFFGFKVSKDAKDGAALENEKVLYYLINIQKGQYNSVDYVSFYINCAIYCAHFEETVGAKVIKNPKEYECIYAQRIERITKLEPNPPVFELGAFVITTHTELGKQYLSDIITKELEKVILHFNHIQTIDQLVDVCIEEGVYGYEKIFKYLCIQKDIKRLETYYSNFMAPFQDDDRRSFFEDRLNHILLENGVPIEL
jgi:hypothetical protein